MHLRHRVITLLMATLTCFSVVATAEAAYAPVEPLAGYEPQTTCSPKVKPGTNALGRWLVKNYRGGYGPTSRSCRGRSLSEHKEGRAVDWRLNARSRTDRTRALRFLKRIKATGPTGEQFELGRRMGVMYVIWNDRIWAAYDDFDSRPYRSSSCRKITLSKCSKTLRHRDHMHISLTRAGGAGKTSFYRGRV